MLGELNLEPGQHQAAPAVRAAPLLSVEIFLIPLSLPTLWASKDQLKKQQKTPDFSVPTPQIP